MKTTAGPVTLARPKVRGTTERFASQLFGKGVTKTNALESLVIAGFVRGLSVRDVEATLVEALGEGAAVSKSTVSRVCEEIQAQFQAWSARRLDDVELDYLFLDGSHFTYHANASAEPVLAAWGIDTDGNLIFSYTTLMTGTDAPVLSAAVYARISADTEGKSLGVQRQLEDCRKLAAARGWPVGREYVDNDISAYNGKPRPGYEQMVADLAAGVRDAVIVYNLDRLHRRPAELEEFVGLCERVGVRQVATVTADIDLGNDDGLFMARIFAAFAAKESGRKSARMKRKYEQNAQQGLPHGPARAFGYEPDKITIREREAAVVRELVGRVIAGESVRALTVWLNDSGVPTVRGARWSTNAVRRIVSSARIAGLREHRGQIIGAAVWDPIITVAEREQVLAALASRSWTRTRAPRTYVLSGLLRCGRCGARLFSQGHCQVNWWAW